MVLSSIMVKLSFSEWLLAELKTRGWSQSDLAKKANVPRQSIGNLLSKVRRPGPDLLQAIARGLDLPVDLLYQKAGLLPPSSSELHDLEKEWLHIFGQAGSDAEREELLELARFELQRLKGRKGKR
jgi:transcriptional regulator with XRE-family HTH domain